METRLLGSLRALNRGIAILTGLVLLGCAVVVLADILMRRVGASFGGTDEISGYVMAITTAWGMGFTLLELGHVRIDILRARAAGAVRAAFDLFAMLMLAGTVTLIAIRCWPVLARSIENGSRANTPLETPLALVQWPWFAGWVWFAVVAWATFALALIMAVKGRFDAAEDAIGCMAETEAKG